MVEPTPADPDRQLEELCRVLNYFNVGYVVFGSHVARLNGVPLETIDVDLVPARLADNLDRLAEALNLLRPRWRVEGLPEGMKIDGGLEARHFLGDSAAVGLAPAWGQSTSSWSPGPSRTATPRSSLGRRWCAGATSRRLGALADLVRSKELLRRAKDIEHLAVLYEQFPDLATGSEHRPSDPP